MTPDPLLVLIESIFKYNTIQSLDITFESIEGPTMIGHLALTWEKK